MSDILDGYFASGVMAGTITYTFDSTGTNVANKVVDETTPVSGSAAIFTANGPFYALGLTITGVETVGGATRELVYGADYMLSPVFAIIFNLCGLEAYTYFLLQNRTAWTSVTVTYQAVGGVKDTVLLEEILALGSFDTANLTIWQGLVGDGAVTANQKITDLLSQTANVFVLGKQLEAIGNNMTAPNGVVRELATAYQNLESTYSVLNSSFQNWLVSMAQAGLTVDELSTAVTTVTALNTAITDSGLLGANPYSSSNKRCIVLNGLGDSNTGLPFLFKSASLNIGIYGTEVPLTLSIPDGYNYHGAINKVITISADVDTAWTLTDLNSHKYLFVQIATDGTLLYSSFDLSPIYIKSGTPSTTTAGQMLYVATSGLWYLDGVVTKPSICVGEVTVGPTTIDSVLTYAIAGTFESVPVVGEPTSVTATLTHNLGYSNLNVQLSMTCINAESGYSSGDVVSNPLLCYTQLSGATLTPIWLPAALWYDSLQVGFNISGLSPETNNLVANHIFTDSTGVGSIIFPLNWNYALTGDTTSAHISMLSMSPAPGNAVGLDASFAGSTSTTAIYQALTTVPGITYTVAIDTTATGIPEGNSTTIMVGTAIDASDLSGGAITISFGITGYVFTFTATTNTSYIQASKVAADYTSPYSAYVSRIDVSSPPSILGVVNKLTGIASAVTSMADWSYTVSVDRDF
jgi:hypothetical protein